MSILSKVTAAQTQAASLVQKEDGAVAMVLGLAMLPFCMAVALSVDYSRAVHMNQKFASAMDSATLAAARLVKDGQLTDDEVKAHALTYFKENIQGHYAVFNDADFDIVIDRANSRIDAKLPAYVPTTFAKIGGFDKMNINQKTQAVFVLRDIEVGLALDVTGSMNQYPSGANKTKLESLKSAFSKFANLMLPDNPVSGQKVRLGLAPYSAAVNAGSYASQVSGGRSKDKCVTERSSNDWNTDRVVGPNQYFNVKADNEYDIDPKEGYAGEPQPNVRKAYFCPTASITPMTSDRKALTQAVDGYEGNGWTAGHIGAQWAWNLISPDWSSVWGKASTGEAYSDKKTVKAVILMTDGVFNTAYHNGRGSAEQALALCDGMKAQGVQVFTLAFGLNDADAKNTLQKCATSGPDYFVDAANEGELDAAFAKFAGKINALRLSQ